MVRARAQLLEVGSVGRLLFHEEEVPREGAVIQRTYQAARWHDRRLFVGAGNRSGAALVRVGDGDGLTTTDGRTPRAL